MKKTKSVEEENPTAIYRRMLSEKRERVQAGLGIKFDMLAKMGQVAEEDQAQISHEEFISLQRNGLDYVQLRLIEEALDRIQARDYGVCLACEQPIPAKRLQALPWARYCVPCQEAISAQQETESPDARRRSKPVNP